MAQAGDWQQTGRTLRELHRTLVDIARRDYERTNLTELSPGESLQLLTTHPDFAWLRGLSELIVDLDVVSDASAAEQAEMAAAARASVEHLLSNAEQPAGDFAKRYWSHVHADPNVAIAHAAVRQALSAWPSAGLDAAELLKERHRLAEKARHLAKRK